MKNKNSILWIVMIIAATMCSCRYETGSTVAPDDLSRIVWQEMPDSTKTVLNQVLDSLGSKRINTEIHTGEVILLSKIEGSKLSEEVIERIPFYLKMKFEDNPSKMPIVVKKETRPGAERSWLTAKQKIFDLIVIDKDFRTGTVAIEEPASYTWIIFVFILGMSCAAGLYYRHNYGEDDKRIIISAVVAGVSLIIMFFFRPYVMSISLTVVSIIIFAYSFLKEKKWDD